MRIVLAGAGALGLEVEQYILDCQRAGRGLLDSEGKEPSYPEVVLDGLYFSDQGRVDDFQTRSVNVYKTLEACSPALHFLIAIGTADIRRRVWRELEAKGARFATLVHPSAVVATTARLGAGTVLCPLSFIGPLARVGRNVIVNTCASIGHDAAIGDHTFFSPYSCLNGNVAVGETCFFGTGAIVTPKHTVGAFSKVAAGTVVSADLEPGSLAHGNPAKSRRMFLVPDQGPNESGEAV